MCRSKAEGGRRCTGGAIRATAPRPNTSVAQLSSAPAGQGRVGQAEARARWAQAERALADAEAAIGPPLGNPSALLLGPLAKQAHHVRDGGDPSVYSEQIAEGRQMLSSLLVSHGDSPDSASAKIDALVAAYDAWFATPEVR